MFYVVNLACLLLIVGVHEYGHLFFAKRFGVSVPDFSIGMGPRLLSWNHNGTRYSFRIVPFGGFVNLPSGEVEALTTWRQIQVYLGGPLANMLLCILAADAFVLSGNRLSFMAAADPLWFLLFYVTLGTVALYILLVPGTVYLLANLLLHPVANFNDVSGPIGILSGDGVSSKLLEGRSLLIQALLITYILSLSIGTLNLVPLSMLDGGKVFRALFSRYRRFIRVWDWGSGAALVFLAVYFLGGDLIKVAIKLFR